MFSIKSEHKSSYLANKKNQLRKQIRKQKLDAIFASKRKDLHLKNISQSQKLQYLHNFAQILHQFFDSTSDQQAENHLKGIFDELTRDNVQFQQAILQQPAKLIKLFTLFPKNRHAIQIFHMMIEYCYDQTFGLDDQKFVFMHNEDSFEVKIEPKDMTEYQQALDILFKTIHEMIPELQNRRHIQHMTTLKEMEEANQINKRIEKKLKMYLTCLANLSTRVNSFIMRQEYVKNYLSIWSKWLLVDYDFCKSQILKYINLAARFVIPFPSLSKFSNSNISQQQFEAEETIVLRLFELCVPQGNREHMDTERHDALAILIIEPLFSYAELRIDVLVKFIDQIMRLLRVVLWKRDRFRFQIVNKIFRLIATIINRLVFEANNEYATEQDINIVHSINIVEIINNMEFLQSFSFYIMYQHWAYKSIFQILNGLIEYCVVFNIEIEKVLKHRNLFIEICHKISYDDRAVMETNLKSIGMICRYAEVKDNNSLLATMVNNGVPDTLENLAYSLLDEFSGQEARQLLELYFSEEQCNRYTTIDQQFQKENHKEQIEIPDRHQVYDD